MRQTSAPILFCAPSTKNLIGQGPDHERYGIKSTTASCSQVHAPRHKSYEGVVMKQRPLTDKQFQLLKMHHAGATDEAIAKELNIHAGTVRLKRAALRRGMSKGIYSNLNDVPLQADLFSIGAA
ncbi:MAG: LuxR C-terminal-related transcriptional regulator [Burkholderiaceae bacterium]|nr:LuxR C-terminal-related transcriptional regulator [Burkholderiaceae bacterium]